MKQFNEITTRQLRGHARSVGAEILVISPFEIIVRFGSLEVAQEAARKFENAALSHIGYGVSTQVKFTPR